MKAEENLSKRIKDLEEKIHAIEKDRDLVKNEILNLESNGRIVYQSFSYTSQQTSPTLHVISISIRERKSRN